MYLCCEFYGELLFCSSISKIGTKTNLISVNSLYSCQIIAIMQQIWNTNTNRNLLCILPTCTYIIYPQQYELAIEWYNTALSINTHLYLFWTRIWMQLNNGSMNNCNWKELIKIKSSCSYEISVCICIYSTLLASLNRTASFCDGEDESNGDLSFVIGIGIGMN